MGLFLVSITIMLNNYEFDNLEHFLDVKDAKK